MSNVNVLPLIAALLIIFLSGTVRAESSSNRTESKKEAAKHVAKKVLPECVFGENMVQFFAYTRENPHGVVLPYNATIEHIREVLQPGHICIGGAHGFLAQANETELLEVYQRLLEVADVNIIAVNWAEGACHNSLTTKSLLGYGKAVENTRAVGRRFAKFFMKLAQAGICAIKDTRVFGHSLGAHVAGFAGKYIYEQSNKKFRIIIGCDPAGPGFEKNDCPERLCASDAQYVEAIHTTVTLGIKRSVGDVDFLVNKGKLAQPGCVLPSCSHSRSLKLLKDSLLPNCTLVGTKSRGDSVTDCTPKSCNVIGFNAPKIPATGTFYVEVDSKEEPFCNHSY